MSEIGMYTVDLYVLSKQLGVIGAIIINLGRTRGNFLWILYGAAEKTRHGDHQKGRMKFC